MLKEVRRCGYENTENIYFVRQEVVEDTFNRFTKKFVDSLMDKSYRQVMAILEVETHCPVISVNVYRNSRKNWINYLVVQGCHSCVFVDFDKNTRRVCRVH